MFTHVKYYSWIVIALCHQYLLEKNIVCYSSLQFQVYDGI